MTNVKALESGRRLDGRLKERKDRMIELYKYIIMLSYSCNKWFERKGCLFEVSVSFSLYFHASKYFLLLIFGMFINSRVTAPVGYSDFFG